MRPIDLSQAWAFLDALEPAHDRFIFQTYDDSRAARPGLARVVAGTLDAALPALQSVSDMGAGVCVQINAGSQRKAAKITGVRALFVDLDSLYAATLAEIASCMPPPSAIVCSSPGKYHVYWRVLDCPLDQFGSAQLRLAQAFRGDPRIKNLDRVMRLPGTWHQKHEPVLVRLVSARDVMYTLGALMAAVLPAATAAHITPRSGTRARDSVTAAMVMASEKFVLPEQIGQGSRVSTLVALAGHMAALGYSEEYIIQEVRRANMARCVPPLEAHEVDQQVLPAVSRFAARAAVDTRACVMQPSVGDQLGIPGNAIGGQIPGSEDIWSAGPGSARLSARQTKHLNDFLRRYVLIEDSSQVADLESPARQTDLLPLTDFRNARANERINDTALAANWLRSPARKSAASTIYLPGHDKLVDLEGGVYWNTFRPAPLEPAKHFDPAKTRIWRDHIAYLFGPGTPNEKYFLQWFMFTVQCPHLRIPWAPLLVSSPGVGKGWLYQCLQKLLGEHNCAMITSDDIGDKKGAYNEWMSGTTLVCIDEMNSGSKWGDMNRLKGLITEPWQVVNHKYGMKRKERVYANFLCFANFINAAALSEDDRRFWVHRVKDPARADAGYYARLFDWLDTDGPAHLLASCLSADLTAFDYATPPPMTVAKREMIQETTSVIEQILQDGISTHTSTLAADIVSVDQIRGYVLRALGEERLPDSMRWMLRTAISRSTRALPQQRYTVTYQGRQTRIELRAVRNFHIWCDVDQNNDIILSEYQRGVAAEFGKSVLRTIKN